MVWSSDVDHKHILVVNKPAHIQLPAFVLLHTHGSYNGAQTIYCNFNCQKYQCSVMTSS